MADLPGPGGDRRSGAGLHALVLAAGAGRRFGGGKLLAPYRGRPLVAHAALAALAAPVRSVVLVTGQDGQRVAEAAQAAANGRLTVVRAERWAEGMSASLQAGASALPDDAEGAFVFLGDMPCVPTDVLPRLGAAVSAGAPAAVPTHEGRRGHPAVLGRALLRRLHEIGGDAGARRLLDGLGSELALVPAGPGVLFDIDEPGQLHLQPQAED